MQISPARITLSRLGELSDSQRTIPPTTIRSTTVWRYRKSAPPACQALPQPRSRVKIAACPGFPAWCGTANQKRPLSAAAQHLVPAPRHGCLSEDAQDSRPMCPRVNTNQWVVQWKYHGTSTVQRHAGGALSSPCRCTDRRTRVPGPMQEQRSTCASHEPQSTLLPNDMVQRPAEEHSTTAKKLTTTP